VPAAATRIKRPGAIWAQPRDDSLSLCLSAEMPCCGVDCGSKIAACSGDCADVAKRFAGTIQFAGTILVLNCGIVSAVLIRFDKLIKRCPVVFRVVLYWGLERC